MLNSDYLQSLGIDSIINYLRKSRQDLELERRTGEDTLKSQADLMERVLAPLGIPYEQKAEIGSGDKISTRPVFQGVIEDLKVAKYQAIAVKEISRMGRGSYTDMGIIYDLLCERRIYIITPWKVYDPKNPADLRQIRFELFMSREEFEMTRERLTGGRFNKALTGQWMAGKSPFGYSLNSTTKKLEINEEEAKTVRIVFDLFINGIQSKNGTVRDVRSRAIATHLRKIGIPSPQGKVNWRPEGIDYMLQNEVYIGVLKYRSTMTIEGRAVERPEDERVVIQDAHDSIIDPETWKQAQDKLQNKRIIHVPRVKSEFIPYELSGLTICKVCGKRMVRQYSNRPYTKKNGEISYHEKELLWCSTAGCTFVKYRPIVEDLIEVLRYFKDIDDNDNVIEEKLKAITAQKNLPPKETEEDITQHIERRKKELKHRLKFALSKHASGVYDDELFLEQKNEIDAELERLNTLSQQREQQQEDEREETIDIHLVKQNMTTILDLYNACTDRGEKNTLLRKVFDHVVIERLEKGRGSSPSKHIIYPVLKYNFIRSDFWHNQ
ncbi:recombinase family protein [Paenibacillus selenitireducens]|uniref:Recombinase family protein n=1 Tax=Paenibacillus selenitireducens TaxID=1324314 RepID=A0A1T2XK36_9BACL|nr:recombinase family protein [Paenibacillus selenitireducens]OPA80239.1 recombinase family protein [Paenibacillus selenitireducens]